MLQPRHAGPSGKGRARRMLPVPSKARGGDPVSSSASSDDEAAHALCLVVKLPSGKATLQVLPSEDPQVGEACPCAAGCARAVALRARVGGVPLCCETTTLVRLVWAYKVVSPRCLCCMLTHVAWRPNPHAR